MAQLNLTADQVLTTTRAVRKRLDFERPVAMETLTQCLEIALQAPTGSNSQGWQFLLITETQQIAAIARLYRQAFADYVAGPNKPTEHHKDDPSMTQVQQRVESSAAYLAANMHRVPAMLIPCCGGRPDAPDLPLAASAAMYGSIIPATWNFMLAARERGLGTCWTTLHLRHEKEVAALLGIPAEVAQVALIPIAYSLGTEFKPGPRKSLEGVLHVNGW